MLILNWAPTDGDEDEFAEDVDVLRWEQRGGAVN